MRKKTVTRRIIAVLLLLAAVFAGLNLFWYGFKYQPYRRMAEKMQTSEYPGGHRYACTDGDYVFRLKMPRYLSFASGYLYVVRKDAEDAAGFVVDESGNLTEKNIPHVDMFLWPQMFSPTQCRVTIYEETDSAWVMTDGRAEFIPDETLSDAENDSLSALFEAHRDEIRELINAAGGFWGDGLF